VKVAIVGATKGMGRAVARELAARGAAICLLGRNATDLERSAADLRARAPHCSIVTAHCDLNDRATLVPALDAAHRALGGLDTVIVTAAAFATQDVLEADTDRAIDLLTQNVAGTIGFCEQARKRLLADGGGTLCVFSSVAGERGRKPVVIYGAGKAAISAYMEGLDHKYRSQGLRAVCVKPGFVKTGMTSGLERPPFAGEPEHVAKLVVRAIARGTPVVYAPRIWALIALVIRWLPRFVMRRVDF
jgi:short-subunit dehydrogenase